MITSLSTSTPPKENQKPPSWADSGFQDKSFERDPGFAKDFYGLPPVADIAVDLVGRTQGAAKSLASEIPGSAVDLFNMFAGKGEHRVNSEQQPSMLPSKERKGMSATGSIEGFQTPKINPEVIRSNIARFQAEQQRVQVQQKQVATKEEARHEIQGISQTEINKALNVNQALDKKHTRKPFYWVQAREKLIQERQKAKKAQDAKKALASGKGKPRRGVRVEQTNQAMKEGNNRVTGANATG